MIGRLRREPVAVAAFLTALVALCLGLDAISPEVAAAVTGMIAAGLVVVRSVVTPVVAAVEKMTEAVATATAGDGGIVDEVADTAGGVVGTVTGLIDNDKEHGE